MRLYNSKKFINLGGLLALFLISFQTAAEAGKIWTVYASGGRATFGPTCFKSSTTKLEMCGTLGGSWNGSKCSVPNAGFYQFAVQSSCDTEGFDGGDTSKCDAEPDFVLCGLVDDGTGGNDGAFDEDSEYCKANPTDYVCVGFPSTDENPPTNEQCSNGLGHPQCCDALAVNSCHASGQTTGSIAYDSILGNPRCTFDCVDINTDDPTDPDDGNEPDNGGNPTDGSNPDPDAETPDSTPPDQPDLVEGDSSNNQQVDRFGSNDVSGNISNISTQAPVNTVAPINSGAMTASDKEVSKHLQNLEHQQVVSNVVLKDIRQLANNQIEFTNDIGKAITSGTNNTVNEIQEQTNVLGSHLNRINSNLQHNSGEITDGFNDANGKLDQIISNTGETNSKMDELIDAVNGIDGGGGSGGLGSLEGQVSLSGGLSGFYQSQYPNGLIGIWESKQSSLQSTPVFAFANQFNGANLGAGVDFDYNWCFNIQGLVNLGCHNLSIPAQVLPFIKIIFLITCAFASYHIVTRGK